MKKQVRKYFIIFMCIFLVSNSVIVSKAKADAFTLTLAAVTTAAGSALSVAAPILLAVAVAYAGYEVYQHREALYSAFTSWYESASNTVKSWLDDTASAIDSGTITDGSTLSIPRDVLNESAAFVNRYSLSFGTEDVTVMNSPVIYVNALTDYITSQTLKDYIAGSDMVTMAPVIITKNSVTHREEITIFKTAGSDYNTLVLYNGSTITAGLTTYDTFLSGTYLYPSSTSVYRYGTSGTYTTDWSSTFYLSGNYLDLMCGDGYRVPGSELFVNGNVITGAVSTWPFTITLIIPQGASVAIGNPTAVNSSGYFDPSLCSIVSAPAGSALDNPLTKENDYTYTPSYVTDADGNENLPIALDDDTVTAINGYVVDGDISEWELTKVVDVPGVTEVDTDKDILDVITDLPGTITGAIQGALEWLFVPDAAAVDAFVLEATTTIESNSGLFTYPIELVIRFLTELSALGKEDCILIIPEIGWNGNIFFIGTVFNFSDFVEKTEFESIYDIYIIVTDFIMIIAVLDLAMKKGSEIIRGN